MPEDNQLSSRREQTAPAERSAVEPYPDREEQPDAGTGSRGRLVAAVVIGGIFLIVVVLHLAGAMSLHSP
jgi:hypothetical protein